MFFVSKTIKLLIGVIYKEGSNKKGKSVRGGGGGGRGTETERTTKGRKEWEGVNKWKTRII